MNEIIGHGGGGGDAPRTPVEAPDSLKSIAYSRILDFISEGEIEGLVDNHKGVYFNGVPLQNQDGSYNFLNAAAGVLPGTQDQPYIPGTPSSEAETYVGVEIKQNLSHSISITDQQSTAVRVRIGIPILSVTDATNGDTNGTDVEIQISVQNAGGGYKPQSLDGREKFSGKCSSMYERDFRIELPSPGPWDVRVSRITADSTSANLRNKTVWQTYTTIIDEKLNYPNSAIAAVQIPADQFSAIPARSYRIRGIKCKVPANYNPRTREYATTGTGTDGFGNWDGTFKVAWTNNPAWCFYDLLTKKRYGLGNKVIESTIDKWGLYAIAKYNDVMVSAGRPKRHTLSNTLSCTASAEDNAIISQTSFNFGKTMTIFIPKVWAYGSLSGASGMIGIDPALHYNVYLLDTFDGARTWAGLGFQVGEKYTVSGNPKSNNNGTRTVVGMFGAEIWMSTEVPMEVNDEWKPFDMVFLKDCVGSDYLVGDQITISGFTNPANNGRAIIKQLDGKKMIFQYDKQMVDETAKNITISTQDFTEPRFTCNLCLQSAADAYKVVGNLASVFQAITYWANGSVMLAQDAPREPEYLFTAANVVDGLFTYSGSARKARHTVAIVTWNDPEDHYKIKYKYVPDEDGLLKYGYRPIQFAAFACSSEGQAARVGKWLLRTEIKDTQLVNFRTGLEGAARSPGAIIKVIDPYKAGRRYAGRIISATTNAITVDGDPIQIEAGHTYTLSCVMPDGSVEEKAVTNAVGSHTVLNTAAFSVAPTQWAVWMLTASDLYPSLYRVLTVNESDKGIYEISALEHHPEKFAEVEEGLILESKPTSVVASWAALDGLAIESSNYMGPGGQIKGKIEVSWNARSGITGYTINWRRKGGNWVAADVTANHFELMEATPGTYEFEITCLVMGLRNAPLVGSYMYAGKTTPPSNVQNFVAQLRNFTINLSWDPIPDLDADIYEVRQGVDWATGVTIAELDTTNFTIEFAASGSYTFWVKAIDSSGNYSEFATSAVVQSNPTTPTSLTMTKSSTKPA